MKPYNTHESKTAEVRNMFDNIAPTYDRLNHTLSLNIDRLWRWRTLKVVQKMQPTHILDMATGTGDLALLMARKMSNVQITGVDLSEQMLEIARQKIAKAGLSTRIQLKVGDVEQTTIASESMDVVTVAFGVRNFGNLRQGLLKLRETLRPKGHLVILEFSTPTLPLYKQLYEWYAHTILPWIGGRMSHDRQAYDYLPQSVDEFPQPQAFLQILSECGFRNTRALSQSFGIAHMYIAEK